MDRDRQIHPRQNRKTLFIYFRDRTLAFAPLIPIAAAVGKLIYNVAVDKTNKKLEALKKSSSVSYSVDFVLPKGDIRRYRCLVVMRHAKEKNANGTKNVIAAIVGYDIDINGDLLSIKPQFIWAKNTVANTRKVDKGKKEDIAFMSGFSLLGIGTQENGIPILATSGQDVKKIGKVQLRVEDVKELNSEISIGPIPLISGSGPTILRVSVTEIGDLGFDVDERIASNKTIKEAIGPALAEGIKAYLK